MRYDELTIEQRKDLDRAAVRLRHQGWLTTGEELWNTIRPPLYAELSDARRDEWWRRAWQWVARYHRW